MTENSSSSGPVEARIRQKLMEALSPAQLDIKNESHLHQHHAGSPGTGESHFRVTVSSDTFVGLNRLARHRTINEILADELTGPVHALAIKATAPGE